MEHDNGAPETQIYKNLEIKYEAEKFTFKSKNLIGKSFNDYFLLFVFEVKDKKRYEKQISSTSEGELNKDLFKKFQYLI